LTRRAQLATCQASLLAASSIGTLTEERDVALEAVGLGTLDFTRDGRRADTEDAGSRSLAVALDKKHIEVQSVGFGEMAVMSSHVRHLTVEVLHFNSEPAMTPNV
jgi:hypothetical protein